MGLEGLLPIPDLLSAKSCLIVFPHPDDAEITMGGTVALLAEKGASVTYAAVTSGDMGTYDATASREDVGRVRKKEQEAAAHALGVKDIVFMEFEDGNTPSPSILRKSIVTLIRRIRPEFVMTLDPWMPYEGHPDHRNTALSVVEACLYAPMPLAYPEDLQNGLAPWQVTGVAMALSIHPNTFIDITRVFEKKISAIKCHKSQFSGLTWAFFEAVLTAKSLDYGKEIGVTYGEAFKVLSLNHLHVMPDAWEM